MKITPINGHVLIEPLVHEAFVSSQKETYEEIGVVVDVCSTLGFDDGGSSGAMRKRNQLHPGDKVYFDSWLAARYPKNDSEYYWLVRYEDIRAVEYV